MGPEIAKIAKIARELSDSIMGVESDGFDSEMIGHIQCSAFITSKYKLVFMTPCCTFFFYLFFVLLFPFFLYFYLFFISPANGAVYFVGILK